MKITSVSLAVLVCVGALFAQRGPFGGGPRAELFRADQLKDYLGLSDHQLQDLKSVQSSFREAAQPLMQQIAEKMKAVREALKQDPNADVSQLRTDIAGLRDSVQNLRAEYRVRAQNYLTSEQTAKLAALQKALELMPAAHQALGLNLLEPPEGFPAGAVGPQFRRPRGMGGPAFRVPPAQ